MLFNAACTNTQKVPVSFQVFRPNPADPTTPLPAKLDTVNQPLEVLIDSGGGSAVVLAETTGSNGFPVYNIDVLSGTLETETITGRVAGDGKPGSGIAHIEDTWTLEVSPEAAVNFGAAVIGAPVPK